MELLVLYGSQTGNAEDTALWFGRNSGRYGLVPTVTAMDDTDVVRLPEAPLVLFVASTTGDGDTPDNMRRFWTFLLRSDLPATSLSAVAFAVVGLGDSSYAKYNVVARRLQRRLLQLGAHELIERCLADDQSPYGALGDTLSRGASHGGILFLLGGLYHLVRPCGQVRYLLHLGIG